MRASFLAIWHDTQETRTGDLPQAVECQNIGVRRVDGWINSAQKSVKTDTARKIAAAALALPPLAWRDR